MFKKKYRKPLYYQKSKAAREAEEYEHYETEDYQPKKQNKNSQYRTKKTSKYDKEYESLDQNDDYGGQQYIYDYVNQNINFGDDMSEYTAEEGTRYKNHSRPPRGYSMPELDFSEDSDCETCNSGQRKRSGYTSEYPSEYQNEEVSRHRKMAKQSLIKRKGVPSETEIDRSPYHRKFKRRFNKRKSYHQEYDEETDNRGFTYQNYYETTDGEMAYNQRPKEVYFDEETGSQSAYSYQQQQGLQDKASESETEMDFEDERKVQKKGRGNMSRQRKNQPQFQIYAANTGESQGIFQKEQSQIPRERIMSVTNYEQSVPMIALKSTSGNKTQDENQAIVYLPVVVMDNAVKLPDSKVITAESLLHNIQDKAEKPLETHIELPQTNMNVYLATENGQGNIFQQARRSVTREDIMPQNIKVYTASAHSFPVDKKPSVVSKKPSMVSKKPSLVSRVFSKTKSPSKTDFPVQKSYINVAPSRTKPVEEKSSKLSIKSGGSIGSKKGIKIKKGRKKDKKLQPEESDSALLSIVNPTDQRTNTVIGEYPKSLQKSASQTMIQNPTVDQMNPAPTILSKSPSFDRFKSLIKQPTQDKNDGSIAKCSTTRKNVDKHISKDCDTDIITIKDIASGKQEESKNAFEQDNAEYASGLTKNKSFTNSLLHKKEQNKKSKESSHHVSRDSHSPNASSKKRRAKPTSPSKNLQSNRSVEFANKTQEFYLMKVLTFDSSALSYLYQVTQYFLGLSIHGTLMEILRNTKQNND